MGRNRVLSFMSQWGSAPTDSTPGTPPPRAASRTPINDGKPPPRIDTASAQNSSAISDAFARHSPTPHSPNAVSRARADSRQGTRPTSMIQAYQAPQVDVASDTPPELQPIFSFLNSHGNKLYQEGYFLKLHDLDSRGRPSADRTWVECFAQLVGTVLSLWDAAALDAAGVDGEVVPTFINLSDAALKMIESLPMSGAQGGRLQNVLSISTAANNRYLFHFNSLNSLTQWTAGIRLAMFEHATLQEAYTGSLIAGKGRYLNNIKAIMDRTRFPTEDWARVRFGAGTPWRRLWFVISPPDEKEFQKAQKMQKKGTSYLRSELPRGDIKFYDTRKVTKKSKPVATINDCYACYAIYPQSKPLIDQSTLVKLEGLVTIHSSPETTAEGFVFIMPEVHPAVTGFEMMLRWLFPVWDTFNLYGRPTRLIADTLDQRGLMFAMPRDRRYGYLDTLDVSALIHETGSQAWSERQWRKQMKKITAERMNSQMESSDGPGHINHRRVGSGPRTSQSSLHRPGVRFDDGDITQSTPHSRSGSPAQRATADGEFALPRRTDSAPPSQQWQSPHKRSTSESQGYKKYQTEQSSRLSHELSRQEDYPPEPPRHDSPPQNYGRPSGPGVMQRIESGVATPTLSSMQAGMHPTTDALQLPPEPVNSPPAFTHNPSSRPANQPAVAPELRRAHSGVDAATLFQMQEASTRQNEAADDEYRQLTSQMVATTDDANRNLGRSHADHSQGTSRAAPAAARLDPAHTSPALGAMVGAALRPESGKPAQQIAAPQPNKRLAHPLPSAPPEEAQRPAMGALTKSSSSVARKPVARKPVQRQSPAITPTRASTPSEHGSLRGAYIDNDALDRVLSEDARLNSMGSIASSATPDYASTASNKSSTGKKSIEKPRMGKLKTVGDPDVPAMNYAGDFDPRSAERKAGDVPTVDFGPTYSYKPTTRPSTGATTRPYDRSRSHSRDRLSAYLGGTPKASPSDNRRRSYFDALEDQPAGQYQAGNRNSTVWTPGAAAPAASAPTSNTTLSAEQWVQQRAAIANQPQVAPRASAPITAHTRQNSSVSTIKQSRKLMKTPPPFAYNSSAEPRQQSSTPPSRPQSRGANSYFGQVSPPNGGAAANLSAREQMQVARATGTPLLGMQTAQRQDNISPGLVGAVEHREREKRAAKAGLRNGQVDVAIRARQQQQAQYQAEAYRQQQTTIAQQQFQQDLQAVKLAYARSTENLRGQRPGHGSEAQRRSWIELPGQNMQGYGYADPNAQYAQGQYAYQQPQQGQWQQQGQWDPRQYNQNSSYGYGQGYR